MSHFEAQNILHSGDLRLAARKQADSIDPLFIVQFSVETEQDGDIRYTTKIIDEPEFYEWTRKNVYSNLTPGGYRTRLRRVLFGVPGYKSLAICPILRNMLCERILSYGKRLWGFQVVLTERRRLSLVNRSSESGDGRHEGTPSSRNPGRTVRALMESNPTTPVSVAPPRSHGVQLKNELVNQHNNNHLGQQKRVHEWREHSRAHPHQQQPIATHAYQQQQRRTQTPLGNGNTQPPPKPPLRPPKPHHKRSAPDTEELLSPWNGKAKNARTGDMDKPDFWDECQLSDDSMEEQRQSSRFEHAVVKQALTELREKQLQYKPEPPLEGEALIARLRRREGQVLQGYDDADSVAFAAFPYPRPPNSCLTYCNQATINLLGGDPTKIPAALAQHPEDSLALAKQVQAMLASKDSPSRVIPVKSRMQPLHDGDPYLYVEGMVEFPTYFRGLIVWFRACTDIREPDRFTANSPK